MVKVVRPKNEPECDGRYRDLSECADHERAGTLSAKVAQVGAQPHAGEGQQKGPSAKIPEHDPLRFGEAELSHRPAHSP